jgi:hypothetical protein
MKTPVPKTPTNGSAPPYGPPEDDPAWVDAQQVFLAARAADDAARTEYQAQAAIRKTSTDKVARARAAARLEELNIKWLEVNAAMQDAERDRDAARQRVIEKRRPAIELEYARRLKKLDTALQVAVEANAACVEWFEQAEQAGVRMDPLHWGELTAGHPHIWSRWDAWRAALSKCNWFVE